MVGYRSSRLSKIGPYFFSEFNRRREELKAEGVDVINLGVGDPDLPPPEHVLDALANAVRDPRAHRYPPFGGTREFREAVAIWYRRRFNVAVDPEREVLALIGSKDGLAHLPLAILNPGDITLVPDPGYPTYHASTIIADCDEVSVLLRADRGYLPDLQAIPRTLAKRARILFLNYPNNPTAAVATLEFFEKAIAFAREHSILLVHDNSYSEVAYDGLCPPSLLQADGAREVGIEFHSLSKTYAMAGWRIGIAVGNANAIGALAAMKTNVDSGVPWAIQQAGIAALTGPEGPTRDRVAVYQRRRDQLVAGLASLGWHPPRPQATFYLWLQVPDGRTGQDFAKDVLDLTGVVLTPGIGYGKEGERFVRVSFTTPGERLEEAIDRLVRAFGTTTGQTYDLAMHSRQPDDST